MELDAQELPFDTWADLAYNSMYTPPVDSIAGPDAPDRQIRSVSFCSGSSLDSGRTGLVLKPVHPEPHRRHPRARGDPESIKHVIPAIPSETARTKKAPARHQQCLHNACQL